MKHAVPRGERADLVMPQELAQDGKPQEDLGEDLVVSGRGRSLGVVLGEAELVGFGDPEGVQPRGGAGVEAGILLDQLLLPLAQRELLAERSVDESGRQHLVESAEERSHGRLEPGVLR